MSLDLTTLRLLKYRSRYDKLAKFVPPTALDERMRIVLDDFGVFFREFPDCNVIEPGPFMLWFKGFRHKGLKPEAVSVFDAILGQVTQDVDPSMESGFLKRLIAAGTANEVADILTKFQNGDEIDLAREVGAAMDKYEAQIDRKVKDAQVLDDIGDILKDEENDTGLHFRLPCLDRHIKPIRPGDFIVIAARPDKGKTTFIADQVTYMAPQLKDVWPEENRDILWFNNEGPGRNIVKRSWQAALGVTTEELIALNNTAPSAGHEDMRTLLREKYKTAIGGRLGALRIMDIHGMWNHEVEDIMARYKPGLVIFDMVDNIRFGGDAANNGQRTDQLLEAMYQWARMMGVKYDCGVMATSQISADGDGLQWPTLPMLKDSKTGKQGAADVIITIGTVNDPMLAKSRYIGCTKNKKVRTGVSSSPLMEVIFDGDRGRYVEVQQ